MLQALKLTAAFLLLTSCVTAQNFRGEPTLLAPAERIRTEQFAYWGVTAPNWSQQCLVRYNDSKGASGATTFSFKEGNVFGWNMVVSRIKTEAVLYHEIDHTVRATAVRRAIPRWLDEGTSSLMENASQEEWEMWHQAGHRSVTRWDQINLNTTEYSKDPTLLAEQYGMGTMAVNILLYRNEPSTLLAFQRDTRKVEDKLPEYYGMTQEDLLTELRHQVNCPPRIQWRPYPFQAGFPKIDNRPLLEVWSASWCEPCQTFKRDYQEDEAFRNALHAHYHIHFRNFDNPWSNLEKGVKRIDKVPSFCVPSRRWRTEGYKSSSPAAERKQALLSALGITTSSPYVRTEPMPNNQQPAQQQTTEPVTEGPQNPTGQGEEAGNRDTLPDRTESPVTPSNTQDDPRVVPPPQNASTGPSVSPERGSEGAQPGFLRRAWNWTAGTAWNNRWALLGLGLTLSGVGAGFGLPMLGKSIAAKAGTTAASIAVSAIEKRLEARHNRQPSVTVPQLPPKPPDPPPVQTEPTPAECHRQDCPKGDLPKTQIVNVVDEVWMKAIIYAHREMLQKYGSNVKEVSCTLKEFISHVRQSAGKPINLS